MTTDFRYELSIMNIKKYKNYFKNTQRQKKRIENSMTFT